MCPDLKKSTRSIVGDVWWLLSATRLVPWLVNPSTTIMSYVSPAVRLLQGKRDPTVNAERIRQDGFNRRH